MTRRAIYLTHPEVNIDPAIATPDWGLSDIGLARARRLASRLQGLSRIQVFSSAERKALETAWPLAARSGRALDVQPAMGENDRSATGFLDAAAFEVARQSFFGAPQMSYRGWETAQSAQERIVAAVRAACNAVADAPLIFCGHGAVGTLLYCSLAGVEIDSKWDQPGPGHFFVFDPDAETVKSHWSPIEELDGLP